MLSVFNQTEQKILLLVLTPSFIAASPLAWLGFACSNFAKKTKGLLAAYDHQCQILDNVSLMWPMLSSQAVRAWNGYNFILQTLGLLRRINSLSSAPVFSSIRYQTIVICNSNLVDLNYKVASLIFCHFWRSIYMTWNTWELKLTHSKSKLMLILSILIVNWWIWIIKFYLWYFVTFGVAYDYVPFRPCTKNGSAKECWSCNAWCPFQQDWRL